MNRGFRNVYPTSQKDSYSANNNIQFKIIVPDGAEIVKNSMVLSGVLKYRKNAAVVDPATDNIFYDEKIGAHGLIDNITTQVSQLGTTESLTNYPRYIKMIEDVNSNSINRLSMSSKNIELKTGGGKDSMLMLAGNAGSTNFCFKPLCFMNRSNRNFTMKDFAQLDMSFVLQPFDKFAYGSDNTVANNCSYTIEELTMSYVVQPISQASQGPLMFRTVASNQYSAESSLTSITMKLPIATQSIAVSGAVRTNMVAPLNYNHIDTIAISNLKWLWNDTDNRLVAYELKNYPELMYQYAKVLKMNDSSMIDSLSPANLNSYGFGIDLGDEMQQAGNKVTIELQSDADNTKIYELFAFYHGMVVLGK